MNFIIYTFTEILSLVKRLLLAFCLISSGILSGQNPFFINYTIADGLPSSNIYSVSQDELGYIWFTTDVGIVKYDSHKFELFNMDDGLSDNEVFSLKKDSQGRYWMLTLSGKTSYLYKGKIYNTKNSPLVNKLTGSSFMVDFFEAKDGSLYFTYKIGDITVLRPNGQIDKIPAQKLASAGIWENNNKLYSFNGDGIYELNSRKLIQPNLQKTVLFKLFHSNFGTFISMQGTLYGVGSNQLMTKITTLPDDKEIINVLIENPNKIWLCTRKGIHLYENGILKNHFFEHDTVTAILKDTDDGYWLSTLNRGVLYIPSFSVYNLSDNSKVNCISINSKKEIWYGDDYSNYYIFNGKTTTKHNLFPQRIPSKVTSIRFFENHTYITGKSGVMQLDKNGRKRLNFAYSDDIYENEKHIYFGSGYLLRVRKNDFEKQLRNTDAILFKRIRSICAVSENELWFGSDNGLFQYNPKDSIIDFTKKNRLLDTSIQSLFYDKDTKMLLVASGWEGIITLQNGIVKHHINRDSGLNSNSCTSIKKIDSNTYLIGSNLGLNSIEFHGEKVKIRNLNTYIGLQNNKIYDINYLDGIVYLATDNGLLYFNRNKLVSLKAVPKCLIVNLKNQNKIATGKLVFPYTQNDITIEFNGISFINRGELTYFYRLNKNKSWKKGKESQINFQSLPSGKYTFEVYCTDQLDNKSTTAAISFEILTPFWQKSWFILLMSIAFIIVLYLFIQFWLKRQRRRFEKEKTIIQMERDKAHLEKQMIELEQKALRLQMNPHFIFNALNTIKGYYSEGDAVNASSYISKFSKLLRMLLENTEQVIPLSKEIEMLNLYVHLNKIRYQDKFEYELAVAENLSSDEIAIPTLLLQPMVENAIIHGLSPKNKKGILKISFRIKDDQLECTVEDNGIGRKASKANSPNQENHQSMALEITTERLELFSSNNRKSAIEIIDLQDNGVALGTKVIITIPLISIW